MYLQKNKKAQSLIEVLLALGVSVFVITALDVLGNLSLRSTSTSLKRAEATKLASAGIEAVKYVKESQDPGCGFSSLADAIGGSTYMCLQVPQDPMACVNNTSCICNALLIENSNIDIPVGPHNCIGQDISYPEIYSNFKRSLLVEIYSQDPKSGETNALLVKSNVDWDDSGNVQNSKSSKLQTVLTKW